MVRLLVVFIVIGWIWVVFLLFLSVFTFVLNLGFLSSSLFYLPFLLSLIGFLGVHFVRVTG